MIEIKKHSGIYQVQTEQIFSGDLDEVWNFFSMPQNLNELTPDEMNFEITSEEPSRMYEGQIISYKVEAFKGVKQNWVTEIKHVVDHVRFVDEQRIGPYEMWHHEHHFKELPDGKIKMNDIVSYKLPFGLLGDLVAGKVIKRKVAHIFTYRKKRVNELFKS